MKKLSIACLLLITWASCKKTATPEKRPFQEWDHDITNIYAHAISPWKAGDTTGNYIGDLLFAILDTIRHENDTSFDLIDHDAGFWSTWSPGEDPHIYSIRYMLEIPLIDTAGGYVDYESIRCPINPALAGQEIFEVIDTTVHKVYSKIFARRHVSMYLKATVQPPNISRIVAAYNYYVQKIHTAPLYGWRIGG